MSLAAAPTNFTVIQGDGKVALSWDISAGATTYTVQRSTDGVTFSTISTPAVNNYLDTSATLGTLYYYQVAVTGSTIYSTAQSVVPTMGGEMSLGEIDTRARQRADRLNSGFVTKSEMQSYIMQSMYELYDLLITVYEDYFKGTDCIFYSVSNQQNYPMPNGVLTFKDNSGNTFTPKPSYKLLGLDIALSGVSVTNGNNGWASVDKYNYLDRNKYFYPNSNSTIYGVFQCQYRWMGANLELIPAPASGQPFRIHYIPRLDAMIQDTDISTTSISGWLEYVIVDVAIKILQKEESNVDILAAQKGALKQRIEESAANKDLGRPDTISDTRRNNGGGEGMSGFKGGW